MFMSTLFMDKEESVLAFFPFRQFYTELNGYLFNDKLNFKIGFDLFDHISEWGNATGTYGRTRYYDVYEENLEVDIESTVNTYFDVQIDEYNTAYEQCVNFGIPNPENCYGISLDQIEENRTSSLNLLLTELENVSGTGINYESNYI